MTVVTNSLTHAKRICYLKIREIHASGYHMLMSLALARRRRLVMMEVLLGSTAFMVHLQLPDTVISGLMVERYLSKSGNP